MDMGAVPRLLDQSVLIYSYFWLLLLVESIYLGCMTTKFTQYE
jgi:hypothetical protein